MPRSAIVTGVAVVGILAGSAAGFMLSSEGTAVAPAAERLPASTVVPSSIAAAPVAAPAPAIVVSENEGDWLGSIEIPELDLVRYVFDGVQISTLDLGPGHWPGTAMPGEAGNVVVAGHRTSQNADFADLDKLEPGDEVIFETTDGRYVYSVESTEIVEPNAMSIADQTEGPTATLFACHPPGSVSQRIVVRLELES